MLTNSSMTRSIIIRVWLSSATVAGERFEPKFDEAKEVPIVLTSLDGLCKLQRVGWDFSALEILTPTSPTLG